LFVCYLEVEALRARLQAYEHREAQWKQHLEKAQLEHTQLQTYQQKLTQAGTHLKTLATDNNRLQQQLDERTASLEQVKQQLQKEQDDLTAQLDYQKKDNHSTIEFLLQHLHLDEDGGGRDSSDKDAIQTSSSSSSTPAVSLPDVTDPEQVRRYIEIVTFNMKVKVKEKGRQLASSRVWSSKWTNRYHLLVTYR
jgi:hypothetical protein